MSNLLDSLLGAERLATCRANEIPFIPQEQSMRHPVHLGRVFADMESRDDHDGGEEYEITVIRHGKADESRRQWFPNSNAANIEASALSFGGAVVLVRAAGAAQ